MISFFNRLFNIRTNEWPRLLLLYLMFFIYVIGWTWGVTILEAAFLQQVGVEALPWFFVAKAVVAIPAIILYTTFADRIRNTNLLIGILAAGAISIGVGLVLLGLNLPIAYPLLYLIMFVPLEDIFYTHWYTYINDFYDTRTAKRVVPVLATAVGLGGIFGGLTMPVLNRFLSTSQIVLIWLIAIVIVACLAWLLPRLFKETKTASELLQRTSPDKQHPSQLDNLREGYRYVTQSSFLRWMALYTFLLFLLLASLQYRTSQILLAELQTTENMSNFIGQLTGITYLIMLPIQLFLLSRIIGRVGLGNANMIYPSGNFVICSSLIFTPSLPTAALAYFGRTNFYGVIGYTIESLLYNAVPVRVKGRARAFIGGLIIPVGSLAGGLLLLSPLANISWFLSVFIGILAVAFVANAFVIRRKYSQALIAMLEQEDFSFLLSEDVSTLTVTDPATLNRLQKKLEESASHEFTVFMAKLISQIGGREAIPILEQAARTAAEARTRSAILDVILAADLRGEAVGQLYTSFLADPDGRVRQSAIAGLEQLAGPTDKQLFAQIVKMVDDPDLDVRARVLSALVHAANFYQMPAAVQVLDQLLTSEDAEQRAYGVRVLGQLGDERAIRRIVDYLSDLADEARLEAAMAIEAISQDKTPGLKTLDDQTKHLLAEKTRHLTRDPIERVRQAALVVLGRLGTRESYPALVDVLTDPSPQIRATAADALVDAGRSVIPIIHPKLNSSDAQLRKMTAVILSRVDPKEFGPLIIGSNVTGNLLTIYRNLGLVEALQPCDRYPSIAVLKSALREQNERLVDEIFYLLSATHDPAALKIISESLHSEVARVRANATEALEALTTPQTAALITPLFEPDLPASKLLTISKETWEMEPPNTTMAIQQLVQNPDDPLLRTITTFALGEIGALIAPQEEQTVSPPQAEPPVEEKRKTRRASAGLGGLFDKLADTTSSSKPSEPDSQDEKRKARRVPPADLFGALADTPAESLAEKKTLLSESAPKAPVDATIQLDTNAIKEKINAEDSRPCYELLFALPEIEAMLETSLTDPAEEVRLAAQAAKRVLAGHQIGDLTRKEKTMLSIIEKIIFLKEVPFFQGMTIDQLRVLANVCEEEMFEEDTRIYKEGDAGGALYVVVNGRVGIEQEKRSGSFARLANIEAHSYFGEMNLFDNSPRTTSAVALQDTLTLKLRREPLIALARQHPDMSLALINVLSQRLRETSDQVAERTRTRPRELHKLFDQFD